MKKILFKAKPYVACAVAILILISSLSSALFFNTSAELSTQSKEILSCKLPIAYYSADEDSFDANENKIKYGSRHVSEAEVGYDEDNIDTKAFWDTYTANFTDSDDQTGTLLQPSTSGDRVVLIYKFSSHTVNKVDLSFGGNKKRDFSIYLSEDKKILFEGSATYTSPNNRNKVFSIDIADASASYIGIVFESPNYELLDLKLHGIKNDVQITGDNVLKNLTPYMYASANEGGFTYNWNKTHYGPSDTDKMFGYSDPSSANKTTWDQYTQNLTDGDAQNGLYIKNENINNCKRVVAIYELDKFYDISALKITAENKSKQFSVYVGQSASSLFDSLPLFTFNNNSDEIIIEACNNKKIKYVGFVFDTPAYTVYEIEVYGTEYIAPLISDSLLKDKTPTRYITATNGSFGWNWHKQYYGNGASEMNYGYNESYPERKTSWDNYTKAVTDGDTGTSMVLRPEFASDNLILVYNIDDYVLSGLNIETSTSSKTFAVYASMKSDALFTEKPIYQVSESKESTYDVIELDKRASYIGIVFEKPNLTLFEFSVFGVKYQRPNYGTDLTDNGELIGIYTTDRGYPAVPNGYNFIDTVSPGKTHMNLLDDDFSTAIQWSPWYCKEKPLPTDPYNVVVIDLKYKSTIDKILIDSKIGGLDIFVADTQVGIFDDINRRVYSSGGDNLIADGTAFDAAYDIPLGENLIDIEDVEGRFVGFVVTRSARSESSNWGMVSINEIQIFGTAQEQDYGENIMLGKTPIMTYRAKHGEYDVSQGTYESAESNSLFTDGNDSKLTYYQFPNNGGKASYGYGALVMIYYLGGTVDINHISLSSGDTNYYYNIGGISMYASASFKDLFNEENCFYDTYGYQNNEGVYDPAYDISCREVNTYHDEEVAGRYLAIVHTRPHPSKVEAWGMIRFAEIEVYGEIIAAENLPDTEIKDAKTGATLNFTFENPDEKFDFVKLGIKSFSFVNVNSALTDEVYMALSNYNYKNESEPFEIVFYDSAGKVFDKSKLAGRTADILIPQNKDNYYYLGEIYDNMVYPCHRAARIEDSILISRIDDLSKVFIYLSEGQPTKIVTPEFDKPLDDGDDIFQDSFINNNTNYVPPIDNNTIQGDENNQIATETNKKPSGGRQWVEVKIDDPLEWFWNIYDTFAQNIWMLVMCIIVLVLGIVLTVLNIIYSIKKRRNIL